VNWFTAFSDNNEPEVINSTNEKDTHYSESSAAGMRMPSHMDMFMRILNNGYSFQSSQ